MRATVSTPGLTIMLNFNIYKCRKRPFCGCEGTYVPRLNFKYFKIVLRFLHFCIQPIVNGVFCHLVFCHCFKARSLIRILPYQSLQKVGYFNITVKMLTCKEVLMPVGLMFSYSHIEYVTLHRILKLVKVKAHARHAFTLKQKNLF